MEENCSIKLFESDLESMLSQVLAKARSRDEKLKAAKEKAVELKHQNETINDVLDLEKQGKNLKKDSRKGKQKRKRQRKDWKNSVPKNRSRKNGNII